MVLYKFKLNDSKAAAFCFENVSKDFSADDRKNSNAYWYIHDLSLYFGNTEIADFLDILKYLIKKPI